MSSSWRHRQRRKQQSPDGIYLDDFINDTNVINDLNDKIISIWNNTKKTNKVLSVHQTGKTRARKLLVAEATLT